MKIRIIPIPVLILPGDFEKRLVVPRDSLIYAIYWDPISDELCLEALTADGIFTSIVGCSDNSLLFELEKLNKWLMAFNLGSSDTFPNHYLVFNKKIRNLPKVFLIRSKHWYKLIQYINVNERVFIGQDYD